MTDIARRLWEGIDPADIPDAERAMEAGSEEIQRLRAEIERLRSEIEEMRGNGLHLLHQLDQARAEIERLRKRIAHLTARLSELEYFWHGTKEELWGTADGQSGGEEKR